jgi:hypothetical protein
VDNNSDGINDKFYTIPGSAGAKDYYPLVVATNASSPANVSGTSPFTITTDIIDYASVGVQNISLYYNFSDSSGIYTFYANSSTGTFNFTQQFPL